ncbi:DUF4232 domain-containing protein [Streptomyces sp. NBC_00102]|uniref:DUF4232 domain-containing protein n=1 Tax=Streptomyces sp. NBC_00102 TaxID=2975652 RepID=UPI002252206F|nr:DUF4232 domain-containing protein [Streptomyces sp. NBC_00102]MCX5396313.1 DUF4232 domain-containing protein [Streptomyces sp. NBC_00102]
MRTRAGERIRRGSGAAALLGVGALVLTGCAGAFVPAGEGEPATAPPATRAPVSSGGPVAADTLDPSVPVHGDVAQSAPTPTVAAQSAPAPTAAPAGDCPASGVRVDMGPVETAMFARAVVLTLVNCGTEPYQVDGYPSVRVLDENGDRLPVPVNPGRSMFGADLGPESVSLRPGGTMKSVLAWVSTKEGGDLIESDSLDLAAAPDSGALNYPLVGHDLRLMDELNMTAWRKKVPG